MTNSYRFRSGWEGALNYLQGEPHLEKNEDQDPERTKFDGSQKVKPATSSFPSLWKALFATLRKCKRVGVDHILSTGV